MKRLYFPDKDKFLSIKQINELLNINKSGRAIHIASLNPEILVRAYYDKTFLKILSQADYYICDGVGVFIAYFLIKHILLVRCTGSDVVKEIIKNKYSIVTFGAQKKVQSILKELYPQLHIYNGTDNIKDITNEELLKIISEINLHKPDYAFFAFGVPHQEYIIEIIKHKIAPCICMGIGGGLDYISGTTLRAPKLLRYVGMEWLFRLILEPKRIIRQLRLPVFIILLIKEYFLTRYDNIKKIF